MPTALTVTLIVLAAAALAAGLYFLIRYVRYRRGTLAGHRIDAALRKYALMRRFKVLRRVHLKLGGREAFIDHMMIGFFGILFVSDVNDTAEYYGDAKGDAWTKVTGKKGRVKMENLVEKNLHNIDVVREIFAKNDVYNIRMEGVVVFCGNRKKTLIGITGAPGLMTFKKFKAYINKAKFDKDNDVDVPALSALIEQHRA